MCVDFILIDDITFINFSEETSYKIKNTTDYQMKIYQECNKDKEQYHFIAEKEEKPFGFDYPKEGTNIYVEITSEKSEFKKSFRIDIDDMLFEQ